MARSAIEWTESTWNPVTGCDKISPGCKHCYAEAMARRLRAMGQPNYRQGFKLALHPAMLERPLAWRKPQVIFVNSMSDLFHKDVPLPFIQRVFDVMRRADWHTFQVLTKRADRLEQSRSGAALAHQRVDGRQCGAEGLHLPHRPPAADSCCSQVPVAGAAPGPAAGPRPGQDRLGDRRRGVRPAGEAHGPVVGFGHPRPVPKGQSAVLLQAMGRPQQKAAGRLLEGRTWDQSPRTGREISPVG